MVTRSRKAKRARRVSVPFLLAARLLDIRATHRAMLERFANFQRQSNVTIEPLNSFIVYGVKNLPITFTPA